MMFRISSGELMMWSALNERNSLSGLNPHVTPTDSMHARRAVSISTPESPTYRISLLGVGDWSNMLKMIDGSGFV